MKKRGMGKDPLEWIGEGAEVSRTKQTRPEQRAEKAQPMPESTRVPSHTASRPETGVSVQKQSDAVDELGRLELPKYATLIPLTARLTEDQIDYLETMERRIMRSRRRRRERITKNTIIRAAIELIRALPWDYEDIADEAELVQRLLDAAGVSPPGP